MSAPLPGAPPVPTALSAEDPHEIGGYRLHARLGSGGMGVVYLAYTPGGRPIALKAVRREFAADREFRERFAQEVASARRIHGLFTAQVVDFGVDDHTPWLATAYVPGPSLDQVVRRHGPLPVRTVLLLVAGIAEALQVIHRADVVHRDLKPANVLIAGDGPRVIDFGIARAADAAALTGTGLRIGTAAFMAPEQALGLRVTPATDVFALGALAAYVAGGVPPFGNGPESAALYRVVHEQPDLARIPGELHDLLARCLAKRPEDRPTTAELIAAVHGHPAVGPRPEFTDGWLPGPVRDELGGAGGAGTGAGAGAGAGGAGFGPGSTARAPAPAPALGTTPAPGPAVAPPADGEEDGPAPSRGRTRRAPRRARRRLQTAALAAFALSASCAAVYHLGLPAEGGPDTAAAAPSPRPPQPAAAAYVPGYRHVELTVPAADYEFDLRTGKVVPAETAAWYLAREADSFVLSEESDAFVSDGAGADGEAAGDSAAGDSADADSAAGDGAGGDLTVADCVRGIETRPVTELPFTGLAGERPFCVRSPDQREIAIVRLLEAARGGSVTISVDHYRRS
ncbi:serine/threonine-protein kinase [Streptomyces sp. NPDC089799]|uniref:serine/threonine-protein kinase n=1 Tax=Streptomyces sp. NPDC089799 TaxID=3155066 RepID=UPI00344169A7